MNVSGNSHVDVKFLKEAFEHILHRMRSVGHTF
jgi:hypothetical protein